MKTIQLVCLQIIVVEFFGIHFVWCEVNLDHFQHAEPTTSTSTPVPIPRPETVPPPIIMETAPPRPIVHYRSQKEAETFTEFNPHPDCNSSKTIPIREWGPYYHDKLSNPRIVNESRVALASLDSRFYSSVGDFCKIPNKTLVRYHESTIDPSAILFVYACNEDIKNDFPFYEYVMVSNITNLKIVDGVMYIYSRNPHDFELGSYERYRHRVTDDTLVENIYKYVEKEIMPIINYAQFTDHQCLQASRRTKTRVMTKLENGFRYLLVRLACGKEAEFLTEVELAQDVIDCSYDEGQMVFSGNSRLIPNPWSPENIKKQRALNATRAKALLKIKDKLMKNENNGSISALFGFQKPKLRPKSQRKSLKAPEKAEESEVIVKLEKGVDRNVRSVDWGRTPEGYIVHSSKKKTFGHSPLFVSTIVMMTYLKPN